MLIEYSLMEFSESNWAPWRYFRAQVKRNAGVTGAFKPARDKSRRFSTVSASDLLMNRPEPARNPVATPSEMNQTAMFKAIEAHEGINW